MKTFYVILFSTMLTLSINAQVCNPSVAPSGLTSTYVSGSGALLEWNAVPGSVGVQIRVTLPSGSTINRRIIGFEKDQFAVPDALLTPGIYIWRVQAACSTIPPYDVTPISASDNFQKDFPNCGTITDIDGNLYNTVVIGSQCWMAENLKVERYSNGDNIPTGLDNTSWFITTAGAFAIFGNVAANKTTYGLLYNWFATVDPRGLCPIGWHVPTDGDWTTLITELDPSTCGSCTGSNHSTIAGGSMKTTGTLAAGTGLWQSPNLAATNNSGFSGLPGGLRLIGGDYDNLGDLGYWWSSSEFFSNTAYFRLLNYNFEYALRDFNDKRSGFSVRCLQD